jgi:hypothetical protein
MKTEGKARSKALSLTAAAFATAMAGQGGAEIRRERLDRIYRISRI